MQQNDYDDGRFWAKYAFTRWKIFAGVSIAPSPVSPHINFFAMHSISMWPQLLSTLTCAWVIGCSHMRVFMAGQKNNGLSKFHARVVHNSRLSHIPPAILANVFASSGAITMTSAHLPKSMCSTGSSRFCHKFHSSVSVRTGTSAGNSIRSKKCNAFLVQITFIWNVKSFECKWQRNEFPFIHWNGHLHSPRIRMDCGCCEIHESIRSIWWWQRCRCMQLTIFSFPFPWIPVPPIGAYVSNSSFT